MKDRWTQVAALSDLPPGSRKLVRTEGNSLLLFNLDGVVHAIADSCPHAGAWLGSGKLDGCWLRCPVHGMTFDVRTGRMRGNAGLALRVYPVRLEGETVGVDLAPALLPPEPGSAPGIGVNQS